MTISGQTCIFILSFHSLRALRIVTFYNLLGNLHHLWDNDLHITKRKKMIMVKVDIQKLICQAIDWLPQ